ncbi:MAG: hypothetical protein A4E64_00165 [Syntrophorhabdus sp. PtaU1.Bin058]|nr:MAG: hypothetical protein A4E64_00165 [Syntrophorhabdus sp. PtaU1.Bin058]
MLGFEFEAGELEYLCGPCAHKGQFFLFFEEVEAFQDKREVSLEKVAPVFHDIRELSGEGMRDDKGRASQHVDEVLVVGAEGRLQTKVIPQPGYDLEIDRFLFQAHVVEELEERREGRVHVREPEEEHLLEDDLPVGDPLCIAVQIVRNADLVLIYAERREGIDKMAHRVLDLFAAEPFIERRERLFHRICVYIITVLCDNVVEDLVDEAHGGQLSRPDRPFREADEVLFPVDLLGEDACCIEVCKDDVPA